MTRARRDRLIIDNMPLVRKVARQVARSFSPLLSIEDFVQDGMLGLCEAARRCKKVSSFQSFAYFRIRGAMVDAHRRKAYRESLNPSLEGMAMITGGYGPRLRSLTQMGAQNETNDIYSPRDTGPLQDDLAAAGERERWLEREISRLPADERGAIGEALEGMKVTAIAERRGRSATWTRGKLSSARRKITLAVIADDFETQRLIAQVLIAAALDWRERAA